MICLLWYLLAFTVEITVPTTDTMTVGEVELTSKDAVEFDFTAPNGWLRLDPDFLLPNLSVTIGVKNETSEEWKWFYSTRTDGLFLTGSDKLAKVKVFYGITTGLRYAAGYWSEENDNVACNKIYVSATFDKYQVPAKSMNCFISASVKDKLNLEQDGAAAGQDEILIRTYANGKQQEQKWPAGVGKQKAVAIFSKKETNVDSNIKITTTDSETKRWGQMTLKQKDRPALSLGDHVVSLLPSGTCSGFEECGKDARVGPEQDGQSSSNKRSKTIIVAVVVSAVIVVIVIVVVVIFVVRSRRVSNRVESSMSGSSEDQVDNQEKENHVRRDSKMRRPSHPRKESYGHLEP